MRAALCRLRHRRQLCVPLPCVRMKQLCCNLHMLLHLCMHPTASPAPHRYPLLRDIRMGIGECATD